MQTSRLQYSARPHKNTQHKALSITVQTACSSVSCYVSVLSICSQKFQSSKEQPKCQVLSWTPVRWNRSWVAPEGSVLLHGPQGQLYGTLSLAVKPNVKVQSKDAVQDVLLLYRDDLYYLNRRNQLIASRAARASSKTCDAIRRAGAE